MGALLAGLLTGLSLIVAIGAQNAYVLRMGPSRHHVSLIVTICALSDIVLIVLGIEGIGSIIRSAFRASGSSMGWCRLLVPLCPPILLASSSSRGIASVGGPRTDP